MRTRAALSGIFASATILIVGWQAGTAVIAHTTGASPTTATATSTGTPVTPSTSGSTSTAGSSSKNGTFTGASEGTRYGNVEVSITVVASKITEVTAIQLTDDGGRSVQISNYAAPILRSEVLRSQSAKVSSVGGATYTSDAYLSSVQSAIDKAGL